MDLSLEKRRKPLFGGLPRCVPCDLGQLSHVMLPDALLEKIAMSSNAYAKQQLPEDKLQEDIICADFLIFAIYYCMGIVELLAKRDYWCRPDGF